MTLQRTLYPSLVVILFFGIAVVAYVLVSGSVTPPNEASPQLLGVRQFTSWSYRAYEEGHGFVGLYPEITDYSEARTTAFIEENKHFANELFAQQEMVEGMILFRHPVALETLPATIVADPHHVKEYYLEYITESGEVIVIGGAPRDGELLPQDTLQQWEDIAATNTRAGTTTGFTRIVMMLTQAGYEVLAKEDAVWFIDVTAEYARQDALKQGYAASEELLSVGYPFPYEPQ